MKRIFRYNYNIYYEIIKEEIITTNKYDNFENIKNKYILDSVLNPYLTNISIISHAYNKDHKQLKINKNNVHICAAITNAYIYPILVSMESALINCNKEKTFLTYHILCSSDFTEKNLLILQSLTKKYSSNSEMIFYNMSDLFMNRYNGRFSQATYYRILSPVIIDVDRIIYLDADTLILKDLSDMYNTELNNNYILGTLDYIAHGIDSLGIKSEKVINGGVLLLNLDKIRKDNKIYDLINIAYNGTHLPCNDQSLLNYVFYPKIGILPYKFSIFNFEDDLDIKKYLTHLRTKIDINEVKEAFKDPTVIHGVLCWPKMWSIHHRYYVFSAANERNNYSCEKYYNLWHSYANKTDYYKEIIFFSHK
jgi:lipopolysaccharide biosynthesis glycosyltransferase